MMMAAMMTKAFFSPRRFFILPKRSFQAYSLHHHHRRRHYHSPDRNGVGLRGERRPRTGPERFWIGEDGLPCLLALHCGDLAKWYVDGHSDAIVNAANEHMLGGGGVDGAIHRAAGPELLEACRKMPLKGGFARCPTGESVITKGYRLPVSHIIHTVGPVYINEEVSAPILEKAYKNSLNLAVKNGIKYVAFPGISCGAFGYPIKDAAQVALRTVQANSNKLEEVHFVLYESTTWRAWLAYADSHFKKVE